MKVFNDFIYDFSVNTLDALFELAEKNNLSRSKKNSSSQPSIVLLSKKAKNKRWYQSKQSKKILLFLAWIFTLALWLLAIVACALVPWIDVKLKLFISSAITGFFSGATLYFLCTPKQISTCAGFLLSSSVSQSVVKPEGYIQEINDSFTNISAILENILGIVPLTSEVIKYMLLLFFAFSFITCFPALFAQCECEGG